MDGVGGGGKKGAETALRLNWMCIVLGRLSLNYDHRRGLEIYIQPQSGSRRGKGFTLPLPLLPPPPLCPHYKVGSLYMAGEVMGW